MGWHSLLSVSVASCILRWSVFSTSASNTDYGSIPVYETVYIVDVALRWCFSGIMSGRVNTLTAEICGISHWAYSYNFCGVQPARLSPGLVRSEQTRSTVVFGKIRSAVKLSWPKGGCPPGVLDTNSTSFCAKYPCCSGTNFPKYYGTYPENNKMRIYLPCCRIEEP